MHTIVFYIAIAWCVVLLCVTALTVIQARSLMVRVLAFDTFTLVLVALLAIWAQTVDGGAYYLDAALALALLSFTGTLAAARYHSQRRLF